MNGPLAKNCYKAYYSAVYGAYTEDEMGLTIFSSSLMVGIGGLLALASKLLVKRVLLDWTGATYFILCSLGTEKKIGFLKLKGLSVMKLERLSLVRTLSN